jgi:hypothetical protein
MTKKVRIENADTAPYKVVVETWERSTLPDVPDTLVGSLRLDHPTQMTGDGTFITSTRYLVIKEAV